MHVTARQEAGVLIIDVCGQVIADHSRQLGEKLTGFLGALPTDAVPLFVLNMREVSYLDSQGLGALIQARQDIANRAGSIVVADPAPNVRRLFTVARITELVPMYDSESAAIHALTQPSSDA